MNVRPELQAELDALAEMLAHWLAQVRHPAQFWPQFERLAAEILDQCADTERRHARACMHPGDAPDASVGGAASPDSGSSYLSATSAAVPPGARFHRRTEGLMKCVLAVAQLQLLGTFQPIEETHQLARREQGRCTPLPVCAFTDRRRSPCPPTSRRC